MDRLGAPELSTNVVEIELVYGGDTPSTAGLDFCYTVAYKSATGDCGGEDPGDKGCPAAPSIAARYLRELGLQASNADIIRLVARHMTQDARFEGLAKCDPAYDDAVRAYVDALLAG